MPIAAIAADRTDHRQHPRPGPDKPIIQHHRRTNQQRHRRIDRHRVILLGRREGEKHHHEPDPAKRQQPGLPRPIHWPVRELERPRKIDAPRKEPCQIEHPEKHRRNRIVIARVAQIQEPQQLFVDEEEPEEPVIFAGHAPHRELPNRRIADCGQNVPGCGDQQDNNRPAKRSKTFPRLQREELPRQSQIDQDRPDRKNHTDQALQKQTGGQTRRKHSRP